MLRLASRIAVVALLLAGQNAYARGVGHSRLLTFEGTLLEYSPHGGVLCGVLLVQQRAKYRVDSVLKGKYADGEIVVNHIACGGDVFKDIPVGSRVRLAVKVRLEKQAANVYTGGREKDGRKIFYVAEGAPAVLEAGGRPVNQ